MNENQEDCLESKKKDRSVYTESGVIQCQACEECLPRFYTLSSRKCKEICGDGKHISQYECDNGNNIDEEGCSQYCTIEEGYDCTVVDLKSVCADVISPKASIKIQPGISLIIIFSEKVHTKVDSKTLESSIDITLNKKCEFTYSLSQTFDPGEVFKILSIEVQPQCSLKNGENTFTVQFKNPLLILDQADNSLETHILKVKTINFFFGYDSNPEVTNDVGMGLSYTMTASFVLVICLYLFQSFAMGSFWAFVNMIQIISYIPGLDCDIPENLRVVFSDYLSIKKIAIPFTMIPDFPYNPLTYINAFMTDAYNEKLNEIGYETMNFVYNFADELLTWISLGLVYILLKILSFAPNETMYFQYNK